MRAFLADRTYYGWVIVACCFLTATVTFGMTYSFSVFFDELATSFPGSEARISLIFGVQTFVIYVGAGVLGGVLDRVGPRRLLLAGTVLLGGGLVAAGTVESYAALLVTYGLVTGLGMSCGYVVAYSTVPIWFERRRGMANGIASAGLGAGLLVVAPLAARLIARYGWQRAYQLLAVVLVVLLLVAVFLLADHPADVGADRSVEFATPEPREYLSIRERLQRAGGTIRSVPFALVVTGWLFIYVPLYVLINHLVRFATLSGMTAAGVAAVSAIGLTTIGARVVVGTFADRVGRTRVVVVCSVVMAAVALLLPVAGSPIVLIGLAGAFGIAYGGNGALLSPYLADLFGTDGLGTLLGLASVSFAFAGLLAPTLASHGVSTLGTYTPVFVVTGVVGLLGATSLAAAGRLQGEL